MIVFRPVGLAELELIAASGFREFPPRLPEQPFFYPVLNEAYAHTIARDWNSRDEASGHVGFVTRFEARDEFLVRYPVKTVGSSAHRELWVPAADLAEFNRHIVGLIESVAAYPGPGFQGRIDSGTHLPVTLVQLARVKRVVYRLRDDLQRIEQIQHATLTTTEFGIAPTHGLLGSNEWWDQIATGRLPTETLRGVISRVYMGSMGDWPEFEVRSDAGELSSWTRET